MDLDTLPVLWRRPGCCSPCFQPPCCGLWSRLGWSTEAPPPSLGSAQELAFLLFGHTHDNRHQSSGEKQSCPHWSVQTCRLFRGDCSRASIDGHAPPSPAKHKHTPPCAIWPRKSPSLFQGCDSANHGHMELRWRRWISMMVYMRNAVRHNNYSHGKSVHLHSWEIVEDFPQSGQMVSGLCCCFWPLPGNSGIHSES